MFTEVNSDTPAARNLLRNIKLIEGQESRLYRNKVNLQFVWYVSANGLGSDSHTFTRLQRHVQSAAELLLKAGKVIALPSSLTDDRGKPHEQIITSGDAKWGIVEGSGYILYNTPSRGEVLWLDETFNAAVEYLKFRMEHGIAMVDPRTIEVASVTINPIANETKTVELLRLQTGFKPTLVS